MLFQEVCENWVEYWDVSPKSLSWRMEIPHYFVCPSFSAIKTSAMPFDARWWWVRMLYTGKDRFWFRSSTLLLKRHHLDLKSRQEYAFLEFSILSPAAYFQHNCVQLGVLLQPERRRKDSFKHKTPWVKN